VLEANMKEEKRSSKEEIESGAKLGHRKKLGLQRVK
jgi:hypothetical protein